MRDDWSRVCMEIPDGGLKPVGKIFISFKGDAIMVREVRIIKCGEIPSKHLSLSLSLSLSASLCLSTCLSISLSACVC